MFKKISFTLILVVLTAGIFAGLVSAKTLDADKSDFDMNTKPRMMIGEVTSIGDSDFTILTHKGESLLVTISEKTQFRIRGGDEPTEAAFADLEVGQYVGIAMQNASDKNPKARLVVILPEDFDPDQIKARSAAGTVTLVSEAGGFFEIKTRDGETRQIVVDENTRYTGAAPSLAELAEGTQVGALVQAQEDDTLLAKTVASREPREPHGKLAQTHGTISAIGNETLTLEDRSRASHTFTVTGDTVFKDRAGEVDGLEDLAVGDVVVVAHLRETEVNEAKAVLLADEAILKLKRTQGLIKSVNQNNLTLDVKGEVMHFTINEDTKVKGWNINSIDDLEKDMRVLVLYQEDENGDLVAKAITGAKRQQKDN